MITDKLKDHLDNKKYTHLVREVGKNKIEKNHGYILAYNNDFVLLHENHDFQLTGYAIYPISQIKKLRYNKADKYFDKIMRLEGIIIIDKFTINYKINLHSWQTIFKSIQKQKLNIIVECEQPDIDSFNIGPIVKLTSQKVYIHYFDATCVYEDHWTPVELTNITRVAFDDGYINTLSKYLRHRKNKK